MTHAVNLDAVGRTSLVTAAMRAIESSRPDALHQDPYAAALAGDLGPELLAELLGDTHAPLDASDVEQAWAGDADTPRAYNAIRTHFFDRFLHAAAHESGIHQLVVLGAGMDSRAYRIRWPDEVRYFEVDRPPVLAYKHDRLAGVPPQADHRAVPADLASPLWTVALTGAGYDPDQPSAWLLEGLLPYLPERMVHQVLNQVAKLAAPGSQIAADLVNTVALAAMPGLDVFARWGCPWLFACDRPEDLFEGHGFTATVVQPGELGAGAEVGRWREAVPSREAADADVQRVWLVTGQRTGA